MSLPQATRDVSEHPGKYSVAAPVNKAEKDADVSRKIRFYGVIEALRKGRLPSNQQIDRTLQYVQNESPVQISQLSAEGRKLVQDTRDIIETARLIVQDKNSDELFQNFIWHTQDVAHETISSTDITHHLPIDREQAKSDSQRAVKHLRTLLHIVLTNSEARKLLSDFGVIGRDLLSKSASKAAQTLAPSEDALRHVDESAPDDQYITEGGRPAGPNETPVLEARLPGTNKTLKHHPDDDQARLRNEDGSERPYSDLRSEAQTQAHGLRKEAHHMVDSARTEAHRNVEDVRTSDAPEEEGRSKRSGFMGKMRDMRDNVTDRIPQQHKERVHDQTEHGRHFFNEDYFPQERRDQFIHRGKKVIIECQKHDDYQESLRWLLGYIEEFAKHGGHTAAAGSHSATSATQDSNLGIALQELRTLLERFANGTSLGIITDAAYVLIDDSRRDPELRGWFNEVNTYIRKVLFEPGYILEPNCNSHASQLSESGRRFYDGKYSSHFDQLFNSVSTWFKTMGEDPLNKRFGEDWARLTRDLLFDSEGSLKFKPELWNDIRKVILPQIIDKVGYIPIPRVEYTDDALDLVVENLALQGRNLFPNIIAMEAHNFIKFSPYNVVNDDSHHRITLHLQHMQADMRDVAFYYRKKSGIPKMNDSGLADVLLGGEGLSATIVLHSTTNDKSSVFKVHDVHVKVDSLKFSIRDSKHDFLYKTLRPLATGLIKRQIQKAIRDALVTGFEYIDGQLVAVRDRMETAKVTDGQNRIDVLKTLFQRKKEEASVKSSTTDREPQFKIVNDKHNSILAEGHPAGWANRMTVKQEEAVHGHEWRSDAFNILN